jgi:putative sigma-54 modulation protein
VALQIVGTNMAITPTVRRYIERKLGKLSRHLSNIIETKVEVSEEKTKSPRQRYLVRTTVASGGAVFHGEERGEDLFIAIDRVADIMVRQLEHHKGKTYEKKGRRVSLSRVELGEAAAPAEPEPMEIDRRVVKHKHFILKPMTVAEAIDEMESLGHDFFIFLDGEARKLKLVYRRKDGKYGLIEPEPE